MNNDNKEIQIFIAKKNIQGVEPSSRESNENYEYLGSINGSSGKRELKSRLFNNNEIIIDNKERLKNEIINNKQVYYRGFQELNVNIPKGNKTLFNTEEKILITSVSGGINFYSNSDKQIYGVCLPYSFSTVNNYYIADIVYIPNNKNVVLSIKASDQLSKDYIVDYSVIVEYIKL